MLKRHFVPAVVLAALSSAALSFQGQPTAALPAVDSSCYMVGGAEQVIDLSSLCGRESSTAPQAQPDSGDVTTLSHEQTMNNAGMTRWTSGRFDDVAFDAWTNQAGGFYYFLWGTVNPADRSDPEVVVFFDSNVSRVNKAFVLGCYFSYGSLCTGSGLSQAGYSERDIEHLTEDLERISTHVRRRGPCNVQCLNSLR